MVELLFSDGSTAKVEEPEALYYEIVKMIRQLRKATGFRDGEVQLGLARRHYLPFLWVLSQRNGRADMVEAVDFMGVRVFLNEKFSR